MRGCGPWKPKATRVRSRIFVLVDSIKELRDVLLRPDARPRFMARDGA